MKKLRAAMHPLVEARVEKYRREAEKAEVKTFKGRKRKRQEAKQQTEEERIAELDREHRNGEEKGRREYCSHCLPNPNPLALARARGHNTSPTHRVSTRGFTQHTQGSVTPTRLTRTI